MSTRSNWKGIEMKVGTRVKLIDNTKSLAGIADVGDTFTVVELDEDGLMFKEFLGLELVQIDADREDVSPGLVAMPEELEVIEDDATQD